jgi:NTE family protein
MAADNIETSFDGNSPAANIDTKSKYKKLEDGVALCLSGGGYRAMIFHIGALWRLNEFG